MKNIRGVLVGDHLAARLLVIVLLVVLMFAQGTQISAGTSQTPVSAYYNEAGFLQASGATRQVSFPAGRSLTTTPYTENGIIIAQSSNLNNTIGDFTPVWVGNEIAVSGREDLTLIFPHPIGSLGIRFQDGIHLGCIGDAAYPNLTYPDCTATGGVDSSFVITLTSGGAFVASVTFDPFADMASFVGIMADTTFDRADIREIGGDVENDFLGAIFTSSTIAPAKGPYRVYLPAVSMWPAQPLYVGLVARWDGTGFLRTDVHQNVGYHLQRYLDTMTDVDIVRSNNLSWYDPDPNDWGISTWYDYYSISTGEYRGSSGASDPSWKWGNSWILPYNIMLTNGLTLLIDGQAFIVSGPFLGTTTTGKSIQYWQLVNRDNFVYYDAGGVWTQRVHPGDIKLRYHAGWSRLLLREDVLRRFYYQGGLTSYTVQYITDLTYSTSIPETLPPAQSSLIATLAQRQSQTNDQTSLANSRMNINPLK